MQAARSPPPRGKLAQTSSSDLDATIVRPHTATNRAAPRTQRDFRDEHIDACRHTSAATTTIGTRPSTRAVLLMPRVPEDASEQVSGPVVDVAGRAV